MLFCLVIFTAYPVLAQEAATGDNIASVPQTALVTGSGALQKANFASETAVVSNPSITDWVDAFSKNVTLGGTSPQCIEMRYSGEVKMNGIPPFRMQFRALVDGVVAKGGAPFFEVFRENSFTTAAMNWWACGLTPGLHTVKIQFGPFLSEETSYVRNRTLTIEFRE